MLKAHASLAEDIRHLSSYVLHCATMSGLFRIQVGEALELGPWIVLGNEDDSGPARSASAPKSFAVLMHFKHAIIVRVYCEGPALIQGSKSRGHHYGLRLVLMISACEIVLVL